MSTNVEVVGYLSSLEDYGMSDIFKLMSRYRDVEGARLIEISNPDEHVIIVYMGGESIKCYNLTEVIYKCYKEH